MSDSSDSSSSNRPVAACFCSTFLADEMWHVYRQITGLRTYEPVVLTEKRRNEERFPFPGGRIVTLPRPNALVREWLRCWHRRIRKSPTPVLPRERRRIEKELRTLGAAVLHIYFGHSGMALLPLLKSQKRPCPAVVSFHGADAGVSMDRPAYREAIREVFRYADAILARSDSLAAQLERLGCPREKITVQRAGIPLDDWPFLERQPPEGGAWQFIQAGRLIEKKACDITLRAFASLHQRLPHTRLVIAGEGPLEEDLRRLARDLGIANAVQFAGFLDQAALRDAYGRAHVFVHPSRTGRDGNVEGVPNTMLEAMATGLPVLATRHGGIPEAVHHERSGRLAQENDWETLAIHMIDLIGDPETWKATGRAAREDVVETFEQSKQIEVLESVYRKVARG